MRKDLTGIKCEACSEGSQKLTEEEIKKYLPMVPGWRIVSESGVKELEKTFDFKNFRQALDFTRKVGEAAEEEGHHPAITTEWGKVTVKWWTHKINGLHLNDFVMAAKVNSLYGIAGKEATR